jgi:hypothetical protein
MYACSHDGHSNMMHAAARGTVMRCMQLWGAWQHQHSSCSRRGGEAAHVGAGTQQGGGMSASLWSVVGPSRPLRERATYCVSLALL